jgi:hypothetical protein
MSINNIIPTNTNPAINNALRSSGSSSGVRSNFITVFLVISSPSSLSNVISIVVIHLLIGLHLHCNQS